MARICICVEVVMVCVWTQCYSCSMAWVEPEGYIGLYTGDCYRKSIIMWKICRVIMGSEL